MINPEKGTPIIEDRALDFYHSDFKQPIWVTYLKTERHREQWLSRVRVSPGAFLNVSKL